MVVVDVGGVGKLEKKMWTGDVWEKNECRSCVGEKAEESAVTLYLIGGKERKKKNDFAVDGEGVELGWVVTKVVEGSNSGMWAGDVWWERVCALGYGERLSEKPEKCGAGSRLKREKKKNVAQVEDGVDFRWWNICGMW